MNNFQLAIFEGIGDETITAFFCPLNSKVDLLFSLCASHYDYFSFWTFFALSKRKILHFFS